MTFLSFPCPASTRSLPRGRKQSCRYRAPASSHSRRRGHFLSFSSTPPADEAMNEAIEVRPCLERPRVESCLPWPCINPLELHVTGSAPSASRSYHHRPICFTLGWNSPLRPSHSPMFPHLLLQAPPPRQALIASLPCFCTRGRRRQRPVPLDPVVRVDRAFAKS